MKKMFKSLLVASALVASGSAAADLFDSFNTSFGADLKYSSMKFAHKALVPVSPKNYPGFNLYLVGRFHENFGVEVGYESTLAQTKKTAASNDAVAFYDATDGATYVIPADLKMSIKNKIDGFHVNFSGFLPLDNDFELVGGFGVGFMRAHMHIITPTIQRTVGLTTTNITINQVGKTTAKAVVRARLGAQYLVADNVGVRTLVGWDGTAAIGNKKLFKDALSVSVGAFVKF